MSRRRRTPWFLALLLACVLGIVEADFARAKLTTERVNAALVLNGQINYRLSDAALEALDNGVPLSFSVQIEVRRENSWFWERAVDTQRLRLIIRFLPLSRVYQAIFLTTGEKITFATREAALAAIGELRRIPLIPEDRLLAGERYEVRVRASLDIEELPLPMRPLAYLSPAWHLSSGWLKCAVEP